MAYTPNADGTVTLGQVFTKEYLDQQEQNLLGQMERVKALIAGNQQDLADLQSQLDDVHEGQAAVAQAQTMQAQAAPAQAV